MNKELAVKHEWTPTQVKLLRDTVCQGATDDEFALFVHAVNRTRLDPFMRQIHAVKRWDSKLKREVMAIQTGIDGYRLIADRTEKYAPGKKTEYTFKKNGDIKSAIAYVQKWHEASKTWIEVSAEAFYDEYVQRTKDGKPNRMWATMPINQTGKCAEALALRKAFPADLSGVYVDEEMEQAEVPGETNPRPKTKTPKPKKKLKPAEVLIQVDEVIKVGETPGGKEIYGIRDGAGTLYGTFDPILADEARLAKETKAECRITFEKGREGLCLLTLEVVVPEGKK